MGSLSNRLLALSFARAVSLTRLFAATPQYDPPPSSTQTPLSSRQGPPQADTPSSRFLKDISWSPSPGPSSLQAKGIFSHPTKKPQHDPRQHSSPNTVCPPPQFLRRLQSDCPLQRPPTQQAHEISQQTMSSFYYYRCVFNCFLPMFHPQCRRPLFIPRLLRCLQPWSHVYVPARPQQDCDLLALFARQLSQLCRILQSFP